MINRLKKLLSVALIAIFILGNTASAAFPKEHLHEYEHQKTSDVVFLDEDSQKNTYSKTPLATYTGKNGVEIRSFSKKFSDTAALKSVYDELLKNGIGEEISYLSNIDLIPDYPYGNGTGGIWYGMWTNKTGSYKLAKGRFIEIYGCDTITFPELANVLSHEYGHHFTYYYINKHGDKEFSNSMKSPYYKIRNLNSYKDIDNGSHMWNPAEIAADDYLQLYGSPMGKKSFAFEDIRDQAASDKGRSYEYSSSMYNLCPQENYKLPLAWQVPGLYNYWSNISGVSAKNTTPPTAPLLALTNIDNGAFTLSWTESIDDNTSDIEYTVIDFTDESALPTPVRTTTDSKGRDSIVGTFTTSYLGGSMTLSDSILSYKSTIRVYAKDKDGNVVSSNDLTLDPNNPKRNLTMLPNTIVGLNRYETSVAISKTGWPNAQSADTAVIATGDNFPDALSASPLAKKYNAPILLTNSKKLDPKVDAELDRLNVKNIILVGGTNAISNNIESYLENKGLNCTRISGNDRYETSIAIAEEIGSADKIVVATGENFPDALSIASYAAKSQMPIILTQNTNIPKSVEHYLANKKIGTSYIIGGQQAIADSQLSKFPNAERLSGRDRYDTNITIAKRFSEDINMDTIYFATGDNFPDALSGSPLASLTGSHIFLVNNKSDNRPITNYISPYHDNIKSINVIGGDAAVKNSVISDILVNMK